MASAAPTFIRVTQKRSLSHKPKDQRLIIKGLGLRRIGHTVDLQDTPAIRGMIVKVQHIVDVEVHAGTAKLFGGRHRGASAKAATKSR